MRRSWLGYSAKIMVVGLCLCAATAWGDDEKKGNQKQGGEKKAAPAAQKIPLDQVPPKILGAVKGRFPGAALSSVEKETENGKVVFDVELKHQGRKYEMDIAEDGTIIEIEKEVALKELSKAVRQAVETKYPKATIKEIMEVNKVKGKTETPDHYEIVIQTVDKKTREIEVSLDGKSIKAGEEEEKK